MLKITQKNAFEVAKGLGRRTYFCSPFVLLAEASGYEKIDGELLVYVHDRVENIEGQFVMPSKIELIRKKSITFVSEQELAMLRKKSVPIKEVISLGHEYIYSAGDLVSMEGSKFKAFRKRVNQFTSKHQFKVLHEYPKEKIKEFIRTWAKSKDLSTYSEDARKEFLWDLDACIEYVDYIGVLPTKNVFVEVSGTLAGFAMTHPFLPNFFIGLQQKVDIKYPGISRFLYHEKAKLYPPDYRFSIGMAASTPGLETFKEELQPIEKVLWYTVNLK